MKPRRARPAPDELEEALSRLKPLSRAIVNLHYTDDYSAARIAEHLGLPLRAVYRRLEEAREELRGLLDPRSPRMQKGYTDLLKAIGRD
jgi:RNA polymerase sigma factor (sigma-70 family)